MLCPSISLYSIQLFPPWTVRSSGPDSSLCWSNLQPSPLNPKSKPPPHPQVQLLPLPKPSLHLAVAPQPWTTASSCRDWHLLCTVSPLYSIHCICLGEAQYSILELTLLNKQPAVSIWRMKPVIMGIRERASKRLAVMYSAVLCLLTGADWTLLLLWTKLPNNWTSYQPWGMWAAPAQEKKCNTKSNFLQFLSNMSSTMWIGNVPYTVVSFFLSSNEWLNGEWYNTATRTVGGGGGGVVHWTCFWRGKDVVGVCGMSFSQRMNEQQALIQRKRESRGLVDRKKRWMKCVCIDCTTELSVF